MKKDLIFAPIIFAIGILLFLLSVTGLVAHMVLSVLGIVALIAYTVLTRKEWKLFPLEIIMRALYGIALISGIIIKVERISALAIVHKASGALFVVAFVILFIHKMVVSKAKKEG